MKILSFIKKHIGIPNDISFSTAEVLIPVSIPKKVCIMMGQNAEAQAIPIVKVGDKVKRGQKIADAAGEHSVPVHTSISGEVTEICSIHNFAGNLVETIVITASELDHALDEESRTRIPKVREWSTMRPKDILSIIADSGIVDHRGVPTALKLSALEKSEFNSLIVSAIEISQYVDNNEAFIRRYPKTIIEGIRIMMAACQIKNAVIVIDKSMGEAYSALNKNTAETSDIKIRRINTKHFQKSKRGLIKAILDSPSVEDGICPVVNVQSAFAAYRAVKLGIPMIDRMITIAGRGNVQVPVGMLISDLLSEVDGNGEEMNIKIAGEDEDNVHKSTIRMPVDKVMTGIMVQYRKKIN